ncbi:hypothetical protein BS47DRAFT_1406455 [Hydnum rufescens UP504]|uniref:Uncharacterized protein n=1 Tax=Hydnum rufescens UP504 TaxID=1448309 RepID=A0A9P6AT26_9AGAM|nr:hypothetical protein BS47DRAFT_1406455 [Hydnum rufescens UP504]
MLRNIENDVALRTKAVHLRGQHAILFIDLLMQVLDKYLDGTCIDCGDLLKLLLRVLEASNRLPSQLLITGVTDMIYEYEGGEATIFKWVKTWKRQDQCEDPYCCAIFLRSLKLQLQKIQREIITHRQLKNRNILELLGIFKSDQHPLTIITPWMENGEALKSMAYVLLYNSCIAVCSNIRLSPHIRGKAMQNLCSNQRLNTKHHKHPHEMDHEPLPSKYPPNTRQRGRMWYHASATAGYGPGAE